MDPAFLKVVQNYVLKYKPHVSILTPCYGGVCFVDYMNSLFNAMNFISSLGICVKYHICQNDSLVTRARNNLIAKAMSDPQTTHMMFIDNDISWDPMAILKLILADKPIVGGIYPLKQYNWKNITTEPSTLKKWIDAKTKSSELKHIPNDLLIQHKLLKYNLHYEGEQIHIENNLTRVKYIATGFMLIQRKVIEEMCLRYSATKYTDDINFLKPEENKWAYALFDCGVEDDRYMSEDWLFCSRWRKIGGEIYIDITVDLTHTGIEKYKGSYIASIMV